MKILLINKFLYHRGGDCTYTFSLSNLLRSKGHDVYYWGMKHPKNYDFEDEKYFPDHIDFEEVNKNKNIINSFRVISRSIYSFHAKKRIREYLKKIKPDIVHLNNIHSHLTPSIIDEINRFNIPIVWTLHDYELICPNIHFLSNEKVCEKCKEHKYYQCVINRCKKNSLTASIVTAIKSYTHYFLNIEKKVDYFIAPSKFLGNKFIEYEWNENKIRHIRNFLPNFSKLNKSNVDDYILYFGGLSPWKGILTLIKAVRELKEVKLVIVGSGTEKDNIEKKIKVDKITNVQLLGYKSGNELDKIVSESKFIIVPSEWYENCPYSIMEAMALGKPVIGANIGGIPELIEYGKTGLLFKSGNVNDLKNKIEWLYKRPEKIKEFGENAKLKAENEF